jgi:Spy/CpxP family protein refolding chaperone
VKRWNLALGLLALFLSGVAIGAMGTAIYFKQTMGHVFSEGQPGIRKLVMKKLVRELDLTEAQRVRVEAIVGEVQTELREFRRQHHREIEAILDRGISQMKPELSKEQQQKIDVLYERLKQHRQKYGSFVTDSGRA